MIKNLIKQIVNNDSKYNIANLIIMKTSNNLYIAFLDSYNLFALYSFFHIFTFENIKYINLFSIHFNYREDDNLNLKANI